MQTIETRYIGPGDHRAPYVIATASGNGTRARVSVTDCTSDDEPHIKAVKALCAKLDWRGSLVAGHTKRGMVWVFTDNNLSPKVTL